MFLVSVFSTLKKGLEDWLIVAHVAPEGGPGDPSDPALDLHPDLDTGGEGDGLGEPDLEPGEDGAGAGEAGGHQTLVRGKYGAIMLCIPANSDWFRE